MALPKSILIQEVGPRDGLQIEKKILTKDEKLALLRSLLDAGLSEIEVGSFVNPKAVPQMAGTAEVVRELPERSDVRYRGLWLNLKGLDNALATGRLHMEGKLSIAASETFIRRNTNRGIDDAIAQMPDWIERYKSAGIEPNALGLMAAFGCNFEGEIPAAKVLDLLGRVATLLEEHDSELTHVVLADTMGWANPTQVQRLVGLVQERFPNVTIRLHLHDTRGLAMSNAFAAMQVGVREFDASVGGLGGCPFAGNKGAAGNICTEDLVFLCREIGVETGIDLDRLVESAQLAESLVGHPLPGKVMNGGTLTANRR
jgi:hydroxymethylglutaryl-CoA lyase